MRKFKRLLCIVLVLALAASLFAFPAMADNDTAKQEDYPFVFVHGLMGGRKIGS